jgi:hypothetical protein
MARSLTLLQTQMIMGRILNLMGMIRKYFYWCPAGGSADAVCKRAGNPPCSCSQSTMMRTSLRITTGKCGRSPNPPMIQPSILQTLARKIVIQHAHGFMRVTKPNWLERLIWRGGRKPAQDDNCKARLLRLGIVRSTGGAQRYPSYLASKSRRCTNDRAGRNTSKDINVRSDHHLQNNQVQIKSTAESSPDCARRVNPLDRR